MSSPVGTDPVPTVRPTVGDRDARILELHGNGLSLRAIATETGVSKTTVHNVISAAGAPA
ncbi:helix-turn-helix domain-containing protein [Cellulosimicrobium sp. Marseille-Q8652]